MKDLDEFDWTALAEALDLYGAAVLREVFEGDEVVALRTLVETAPESQHLGSLNLDAGDRRLISNLLPQTIRTFGASLHAHLAPIADRWATRDHDNLDADDDGRQTVATANRFAPASLHAESIVLKKDERILLRPGSQAAGGFAMEATILLSEPEKDFQGGELAMAEQRPRMQTRPMVIDVKCGDVAIFSGGHRPFKGTKGYYRVTLKTAISRVREGKRVAIELTFSDNMHSLLLPDALPE